MNKIPKVIHYCWFGGNEKSKLIKKCIASWKKYCPDYEIIEWNEDNFNLNINQYVREAYDNKKWAFVTDYVRLWVIYNYGGIYLDTDVELIKNLDSLLSYDSFFALETSNYIATGLGFGAVKSNEIVKTMMDDYNEEHFQETDGSLNLLPCPVRNSNSISHIYKKINYDKKINVFDNNAFLGTEFFCPFIPATGEMKKTNETIGIHWYNASWRSRKTNIKGVLLRPIKRIVGLDRFNKIKAVIKKGNNI